jgi:hypothetical protein
LTAEESTSPAKVGKEPGCELVARQSTGRNIEHQPLLVVDSRVNLTAVQNQEYFRRSMADAFVPVDEGVVIHQRETEGGCCVSEGAVKVGTSETGSRLGKGRLQRTEVTDPGGTTRGFDHRAVEIDDLSEREVSHQARRR